MQIPPQRAVSLLAAVTIALIVFAVGALLWQMRKNELERARLDTASLAHMFQEQIERDFDSAHQTMRWVQWRMQSDYGEQLALGSAEARLLLASRVLAAPQVDVMALADATGRVVNASRLDERFSASVAGTDYFKAFQAGFGDLFIDRPMRSQTGEWTLDMARPINDAKGRFRGLVIVTMKIPRLEELYGWLHLDYPRPLAVYLADGTLVASLPPRANMIGDRPPELGSGSLPVQDTQVRIHKYVGGDGAGHEFALARVPSFPLLVSVKNDDDIALASWRERAISISLGAFLVCAFVLVSALMLIARLNREQALKQELVDTRERHQRTVDSLMDAIVGFDASLNITLFNPAAQKMFGLGEAEAMGACIERLLPPQVRAAQMQRLHEFMSSQTASRMMPSEANVAGLRADGSEFPLEGSLSRTTVNGQPQVTAVLRDLTECRRTERMLREMNDQLRALSTSLQEVREQERTRIAYELHDELGQQLTGLKLELSWLGARVKEGRQAMPAEIDAMRHQLDATIASVRRIATELRPRLLDDLGFGPAVSWQAAEFARRSGVQVSLNLPAAAEVRDDAVATALFRIVQESLTNVARHASATWVRIDLMTVADELVLRVSDDGRGLHLSGTGTGIGLVSMRERATAVGGSLTMHSTPGKGTTIAVELPLHAHMSLPLEQPA